jgi:hypothetical protein
VIPEKGQRVTADAALPRGEARRPVDGRLTKESVSQAFTVGHNTHVPPIIGSDTCEVSLLKRSPMPPRPPGKD